MDNFTPWTSLAGGVLIGLSASLLLLSHGRIAGISNILGTLLLPRSWERWRVLFMLGLLVGGVVCSRLEPGFFRDSIQRPPLLIILAGLLVGFGTSLGGGCTSGHGVCGVSRLSPRSLAATATFMGTGAITAYLARQLLTGGFW